MAAGQTASTIVRGNRAGGGKTRTLRLGRMVAQGQKRTFGDVDLMPALPPITDIGRFG
jgi:hypothetical protein